MAWTFDVNRVFPIDPSGAAWHQDVVFQLKALLKTAGATVIESSDGTGGSYVAMNGDVIASPSDLNASAWFRIQMPAVSMVSREFVFFHDTTGNRYDVYYSASAGFNGGSPSDTVPPTATDGQQFTPNGAEWIPNENLTITDYVIGGAAEGYAWGVFHRRRGTSKTLAGLGLDVLTDALVGDTDPAVVWRGSDADTQWWRDFGEQNWWRGNGTSPTKQTTSKAWGWYQKDGGGETFLNWGGNIGLFSDVSGYDEALTEAGRSLYGGEVEILPHPYGRDPSLANPGVKGNSGMLRCIQGGLAEGVVIPPYGANAHALISHGLVAVPWPAGVAPLL